MFHVKLLLYIRCSTIHVKCLGVENYSKTYEMQVAKVLIVRMFSITIYSTRYCGQDHIVALTPFLILDVYTPKARFPHCQTAKLTAVIGTILR